MVQQQETIPVNNKDLPFLEKVKAQAELPDIFDARDLTLVVYRTMRDLMSKETRQSVGEELEKPVGKTENQRLQMDIAELWRDTNPLVAWISNIRPPLQFDDKTFIYRIAQEGGVPRNISAEKVIKSVFSATKDELSAAKIDEIANCLPGQIKVFWQNA